VNQHVQSINAAVASVRERLASTATLEPVQVLDSVVEALALAQRYSSVEIYLAFDGVGVCKSSRRHTLRDTTMANVNAEIAVPIMLGAKTLGLVVAETGRALTSARSTRKERAILQQVAELLAKYVAANRLTANRGKHAPRTTGDKLQAVSTTAKRKGPQSARATVRKAAAGDHFPR
jgi:transcriptional regulator with GAF, ATPase, and Fis domain